MTLAVDRDVSVRHMLLKVASLASLDILFLILMQGVSGSSIHKLLFGVNWHISSSLIKHSCQRGNLGSRGHHFR